MESKKILEYILYNTGQSILEFEDSKGNNSYWIVDRFEPQVSASTGSIDYNYVKGINIDSLISLNTHIQDEKSFDNNFQIFLEKNKPLSMKFSTLYKWKLYSK